MQKHKYLDEFLIGILKKIRRLSIFQVMERFLCGNLNHIILHPYKI